MKNFTPTWAHIMWWLGGFWSANPTIDAVQHRAPYDDPGRNFVFAGIGFDLSAKAACGATAAG